MGISTYTSLVHTLQEFIEDDSEEVSVMIPTAILLAEERLSKDLDLKQLTVDTSARTSAITNVSIAVSGIETRVSTGIDANSFLYFKNVYFNGEKLDQVDVSYTKEINRYEASAKASPRYYGFENTANTIVVAPPVSSVKFSITYNKKPTRLSNSVQTNTLMNKAPELLFYASMIELSRALKNWETINVWESTYTNLLTSNLNTTRRERTDIGQKHFSVNETQSTTGEQ
jgi:hypothetical protein